MEKFKFELVTDLDNGNGHLIATNTAKGARYQSGNLAAANHADLVEKAKELKEQFLFEIEKKASKHGNA